MPKLGLTMTQGKVVKWLKQDGEQVEQGQPLVVVMSKKITYEMEAPASGVVRIVAQPKEARKVTEVIGFILEPGEPIPEVDEVTPFPAVGAPKVAETAPPPAARAPEEPLREVRSSPAARRLARELGVDITRVPGTGRDGRITESDVQRFYEEQSRVLASPLARRMAEEEGLDLSQIEGTGPGGRITEEDVLCALKAPEVAPPEAIPFAGMREAIAEQMVHSLQTMAQITLTSKADVTELRATREALRKRWECKISYTDLLVKAVATALREHRLLGARLEGDEIVLPTEINVGVAVALEDGLIVPVIRNVDRMTVPEISDRIKALARRARSDELSVDQVTGAVFTITNLGMYGVDAFTPIINPPEVAILGVGRITEELAWVNGQVTPRSKVVLSLTIDHRVVDGAPGAAFLQTLVQFLEHPALIFAEGAAALPSTLKGAAALPSTPKGEA
jgi:pyruvate dehydrogenase E2 component (dihydrolipoamide acetyltransferase)